MLRGMQEHTQFIVITHNRKTMETRTGLRRHPGGAGRFQADFRSVELTPPRRRMYTRGGVFPWLQVSPGVSRSCFR
jgi:hypothetical protein